jgi:hypothetical protein
MANDRFVGWDEGILGNSNIPAMKLGEKSTLYVTRYVHATEMIFIYFFTMGLADVDITVTLHTETGERATSLLANIIYVYTRLIIFGLL